MQPALLSAQCFCLAFLTILFVQSGLDKIINYKGNLEWLTGHFSKSPLKRTVGLLLPAITLLEVTSGIFCGAGVVYLLIDGSVMPGLTGAQLSALSVIALFFGQRIAQDYVGAASLTTYFIISIMTIWLLST